MNANTTVTHSQGITIADIWYVLFRHKWKIIFLSTLGLVGAGLIWFLWKPEYQSSAKILIKYVVEAKSPASSGIGDSSVKSPDQGGETVIATEYQILRSYDLALDVAEKFGPARILGPGKGTNVASAASEVRGGLEPMVDRGTVISLVMKHSDRTIVQPLLAQVIDSYFDKHKKIHRPGDTYSLLVSQNEQLHQELRATEEALRQAKAAARIETVEDSKRLLNEQTSRINEQIYLANAEMADRKASLEQLEKLMPGLPSATSSSNSVPSENVATPTAAELSTYRRAVLQLESLAKREQDLLINFTPESSFVQQLRSQVATNETVKAELEAKYPLLAQTQPTGISTADEESKRLRSAIMSERARIVGLQSRIELLEQQTAGVRARIGEVDAAETLIRDLTRKKEMQEANYKIIATSLKQSEIAEALGPGRVSNIVEIQKPTPPFDNSLEARKKWTIITAAGSIAFALALAFLLELYVDQSLRRPSDVEAKIGLPLFMNIPKLHLNGHSRVKLIGPGPNGETALARKGNKGASWDADSPLRPFSDALRDRLINFFEFKNLTHKPKLVAVTSCRDGSGVSTVAASLAASLSETGEGNVLLVDLNERNGSGTKQFAKGALTNGIDQALNHETRETVQVQDKLYVVSGAKGAGLPAAIPNRFKDLVPKLKASDYDYIIFDLPPVSQISVTTRVARFMDMMLMVVESEKSDRNLIKRAGKLLSESKTNLGIVLNKSRKYVPRTTSQDI